MTHTPTFGILIFVHSEVSFMFCQVRKFFEVEGNQVTEEEEFLHYYALPFVREPAKHPTFNTLFQVGR